MTDSMNKSTDSRLIASGRVEGVSVYTRQGEKLGTIKDIYIDKRSGRAEFASVGSGGFLGAGENYRPVPWQVLDYDAQKDGFVVDLDRTSLEKAPAYSKDQLYGPDTAWTSRVSGYYNATARA